MRELKWNRNDVGGGSALRKRGEAESLKEKKPYEIGLRNLRIEISVVFLQIKKSIISSDKFH